MIKPSEFLLPSAPVWLKFVCVVVWCGVRSEPRSIYLALRDRMKDGDHFVIKRITFGKLGPFFIFVVIELFSCDMSVKRSMVIVELAMSARCTESRESETAA